MSSAAKPAYLFKINFYLPSTFDINLAILTAGLLQVVDFWLYMGLACILTTCNMNENEPGNKRQTYFLSI